MRFRPIHGIVLVLLAAGVLYGSQYLLEGGLDRSSYERVKPGRDGLVHVDGAAIGPQQVRFFRFLNSGNQEIKFLVGRDAAGTVQAAYDANEICYKLGRGYRYENGWLTCNKCDKAFKLEETNAGGGGCRPVPLRYQMAGNDIVFTENDIVAGWRYFH